MTHDIEEAEKQLNRDIETALEKYCKTSGQFIKELTIDPRFRMMYLGGKEIPTCSPVIEIRKYI